MGCLEGSVQSWYLCLLLGPCSRCPARWRVQGELPRRSLRHFQCFRCAPVDLWPRARSFCVGADQCKPRLACTASHSYLTQIAVALAIIACAVVVACALVASSDLQGKRVALYGIGSGEETEANNAADVAFGTFAGSEANEEIVTEAGANYKETFEEIEESAEFAETLEEVEAAIDQGTEEGALLAHYYAGNDSPP